MSRFAAFWTRCIEAVDQWGQIALPPNYLINRYFELTIAASLFMAIVLLFMKHAGFCNRLRHIRSSTTACAYQILLYRRQPRIVLRAQGHLLLHNLAYILYLAPTITFATLLLLVTFGTLENRYGFLPAAVNQPVVVRATPIDPSVPLARLKPRDLDDTVTLTAIARVPGAGSAWFRLEPTKRGLTSLAFSRTSARAAVLNVGLSGRPAVAKQFIDGIRIEIGYPSKPSNTWLTHFSLISFGAAFPLLLLLRMRL